MRQDVYPLNFSGTINKKYIDSTWGGRAGHIIVLTYPGESYFCYNDIAYDLIDVGDSIDKKGGTLKFTLYKKDSIIIYYPTCFGKEVQD